MAKKKAAGTPARAGAASGLALASGLVLPAVAQGREWDLRGDAGIFVAFHFGDPRGGDLGFGLEAHGVYVDVDHDCGGAQQLFSGLVGRAEVIDFKRLRLTAGPVVGRSNGLWGVAGEVTGGMGFGVDRGPIVHLSAEATGLFLLNARLGHTVTRDWQAGLGVRFPPLSRSGGCAIGRPLRRTEGRALVQGAEAAGPPAAPPVAPDCARASSIWARRACLEWASVPAFRELGEQLELCGAPPALATRARAAALEELGHAVASVDVAGALGHLDCVSLDPPVTERRPAAAGADGLRRLALESWLDGCIGEGASALIAAHERDGTTDPVIRDVQARIAVEESRHAELAWEIVEWTLAADRAGVGALLAAVAEAHPRPNRDAAAATSGDGLGTFGILAAAAAGCLQGEVHAAAETRLRARLGA